MMNLIDWKLSTENFRWRFSLTTKGCRHIDLPLDSIQFSFKGSLYPAQCSIKKIVSVTFVKKYLKHIQKENPYFDFEKKQQELNLQPNRMLIGYVFLMRKWKLIGNLFWTELDFFK